MTDTERILRYGLGRPPARAGLRLRSERELSALLGVDRMKIQRTLNTLVEEGLLIRRHGSGTFVRKAPDAAPVKLKDLPTRLRKIATESLFAEPAQSSGRLRPTKQQQQLHVGVWSDLHCTTRTNESIVAGLKHRARKLGHRLTMHSVIQSRDVPMDVEELAERLQEAPCDGYIGVLRWAELFDEAYAMAWGPAKPPLAYIWADTAPGLLAPVTSADTRNAIERAVQIFAREGFERIALLAIAPWDGQGPHDQVKSYERAVEDCNLSYCQVACAHYDDEAAAEAIKRLLDLDDPPEAVYVANDEVMPGVATALADRGVAPGRDIGLITLANKGNPLPNGANWSRLEFDPAMLGQMAMDSLLRVIRTAGEEPRSLVQLATWRCGDTHCRTPDASHTAKRKDRDHV